MVVEDSVNGVRAARAAGLKVLLVPFRRVHEKIDTDWRIGTLKEFDLEEYY